MNLQINDELQFINKDTDEVFGFTIITSLYTKTFGTLKDIDWENYERYASDDLM